MLGSTESWRAHALPGRVSTVSLWLMAAMWLRGPVLLDLPDFQNKQINKKRGFST